MSNNTFWEKAIPIGYYDLIHSTIKGNSKIQVNWHHISYSKVSEYLKEDINHLDYACGPGTLIGLYSNSNSTGFDIAIMQIEYANSKYRKHNARFTSDENEIFNNKFNVITIMGLFEYLEEKEILNLLSKLKNSLTKDGKILITTPNYNSSIRLLEIFSNYFGSINYSKVNINKFNKKRLIQTISKTEFKLKKINKFLNFGILISIFNLNSGVKFEKFISKTFNNFFGYLIFVEIEIGN